MRFPENRFEREMRRAHLVARMLFHEARTGTIAAWTGASHEQVRKIARSTRETPSGRAQVRHRGQSPKQLAYFFRSALIGSHAAVLGFLFEHTGALPHEDRAAPEKLFRCVSRAEQLCEAFDAYRAMIGEPVTLFAYPNGRPRRDYAREHVEMVRQAGFSAAVSTAWGACRRASDRFQLPRMLPWDTSALKFAARLLRTHRAAPAESV